MRKFVIRIMLIGLFILLLSNIVVAETETMSLEELEPGMQGVGKTVLQGTEIEEFAVEIVSVLENQSMDQDLILVKTSGDVIEKTGGIASGMSGSPVYVQGKLIGAIGYGWQMANHKIGMVTPIKGMMDLFDEEERPQEEIMLDKPIKISGKSYKKIEFNSQKKKDTQPHTLQAYPASTPLLVSGLTGRARDKLADKLSDFDVKPVKSSGLAKDVEDVSLKPGSAVALQLVRGDVNVSAIGTLTYRDDDDLLAFGHPFLSKGNANYLLSAAYIHQMITSIKMPFKIGSPADLKGIATQDRAAGIAGKIGKFPNVVPMEVEVVDNDLERNETYNLQIIHDEELLPKLSSVALLQAIDKTIDRKGKGSAKISLEVTSSNLPGNGLKQENLYHSSSDIAANSLEGFMQSINLLSSNPFKEVNFADIKVKVEVSKKERVALLEEVNLDKKKVKPGEEIEAEIKFRPHRQDLITKNVTVQVPEDVEQEQLEFYVLSGQDSNLEQLNSSQNGDSNFQTNNIKSLKELIKIYQSQKQNNELVVQLKQGYTPQAQDEEGQKNVVHDEEMQEYNNNLDEEVLETEYVLQGAVRKQIEIKTEKDSQNTDDNGQTRQQEKQTEEQERQTKEKNNK
ncbi:MAG: SpoIVB peptidase S55 domain-containing protein [Bacillota bacterium]